MESPTLCSTVAAWAKLAILRLIPHTSSSWSPTCSPAWSARLLLDTELTNTPPDDP